MRICWQACAALALVVGGCGPAALPGGPGQGGPQASQPGADGAASSTGFGELSGDEAVTYLKAAASALIDDWRPLAFTGELKPYDPDRLSTDAADRLFSEACEESEIWRETRAFDVPMGQALTAIGTAEGPVVYQQVWEKAAWDDRLIYVGVRLQDRACGAFDRKAGSIKIGGDADVVAVLIAAGAIREMDTEADRRDLTLKQSADARELIPVMLSANGEGAPHPDELPIYPSAEFRQMIQGKTKQQVLALLGRPLSIWGDRAGGQVYDYSSDATYLGEVPFRVVDEATGIVFGSVQVVFGPHGRATGVNL